MPHFASKNAQYLFIHPFTKLNLTNVYARPKYKAFRKLAEESQLKVVIIGSGIAELSAAIALRKAGLQVIAYERAPRLTEVGAGISLWSNALRALDNIGVGADIRERNEPLRRCEFRGNDGFLVAASFPASKLEGALGSRPVIGMLHRAKLVESLSGCLPDNVARYGYEALDINSGAVPSCYAKGRFLASIPLTSVCETVEIAPDLSRATSRKSHRHLPIFSLSTAY